MLAADVRTGTDDPRVTAPDLVRRALAARPGRARAGGRVGLPAPIGFTDGSGLRPQVGHSAAGAAGLGNDRADGFKRSLRQLRDGPYWRLDLCR